MGNTLLSASFKTPIVVWVLAPYLETSDENLSYYYDFTQSIAEYKKVFEALDVEWIWQPVTTQKATEIIHTIHQQKIEGNKIPIVLNLCDGDDINGTPGVSIIKLLEKAGLIFTGANEHYYTITTSKVDMKNAFDAAKVATPKWKTINNTTDDTTRFFETLGTPFIIKPAVSGGSLGIGVKNVVHNQQQLQTQVMQLFDGYRGWQLTSDGLVAEAFVNGAEYTVFLVGNYLDSANAIIYPPVERVFHNSLNEYEKFLSFDRLWEMYEEEKAMPNNEFFYEYKKVEGEISKQIQQLAWDAFVAVKGVGYTRADIRVDKLTGKLYVLEVNAQCGISEDEDYTSIGAILKQSNTSFTQLIVQIINEAISYQVVN